MAIRGGVDLVLETTYAPIQEASHHRRVEGLGADHEVTAPPCADREHLID
ncbi:hypothetical protein IPZ68_08500 [Streptomyces arenae]|nr:hypothetical protein [Streptomyces arenae]